MFWSKISNVLHSCIAQFVPGRYQSCKPFSYPMHIRRLLGLKKLWYSKDKVRYKHFARKYDMAVKEFILSQENNVLKKKSLSSFYSYVNSKLTTSQCIPPLIDSNDNLAVLIMINVLCLMIILLPFLLLMTVCSQNLCLVSLKTNP